MKIWHLRFALDDYENLIPLKNLTHEEYQMFDGRKLKDIWRPLPVKRCEPEKNQELGDAPGFDIPVFSKRALEVLRPLIQDSIEELELQFEEGEYYGINVTTVLNVIDYEKSEYKMFSDGNRIMLFEKYAFRECEELSKYNIFKIVDEPLRWAFVSDKFKEAIEKNNLTGFALKLVWDSEQD